jgi:hypothetical protein
MAVVINEFEVVPAASSDAPAFTIEPAPKLAPEPDVTRALRIAHQRAMRVRAC